MTSDSAVQFDTNSRIHVGLVARNLGRSVEFYRVLLGQEPTKTRPGYAKFEVGDPPLNLALNETGGPTGPNNPVSHFGIQVKSTGAVRKMTERLDAAGLGTRVEENTTCCYAVQNKVWASDPDGNKWEVFVVLDNEGASHGSPSSDCCRPAESTPDEACGSAVRNGASLPVALGDAAATPSATGCCGPSVSAVCCGTEPQVS
jgi:catechol 2,3-dioxygenase-like lactoylglutathione lyase family enzyme